jgi:hypothetical protein
MLIFIDCRRENSMGVTGRLHDRLAAAFWLEKSIRRCESIRPTSAL